MQQKNWSFKFCLGTVVDKEVLGAKSSWSGLACYDISQGSNPDMQGGGGGDLLTQTPTKNETQKQNAPAR